MRSPAIDRLLPEYKSDKAVPLPLYFDAPTRDSESCEATCPNLFLLSGKADPVEPRAVYLLAAAGTGKS